jgi:hypothetical protein
MGFSQIVAAVTAFVTGLVPLSCQHKAAPPKAPSPAAPAAVAARSTTNSVNPPHSAIPVDSMLHDLGEVALTNHYERSLQLGAGKECIIYPNLMDKQNAELTVTYETKMSSGQVHDMIVTQVNAKNGEPTEVMVGDFQLNLTPNIISE